MAKPDRKPPKKGKRSLRGKGPTPRAEDRPYHKKFKSKEENQRRRTERKRIDAKRSDRKRDYRRDPKDHVDTVAGRNAVVEALRAGIPAKELVVAVGVDVDERLNESIRLSQKMGIGIREVERRQIENMTASPTTKALRSSLNLSSIHRRKKFLRALKNLHSSLPSME